MKRTNPQVDAFLNRTEQWREEFEQLREIVLDCHLAEEFKWRKPCYTFRNRNIVIIQGFKEYCALMFFEGALLKDPHGILVRPGEHTQAGRQIRFTGVREIVELGPVVKDYIHEAVEAEKAGLKVERNAELEIPDEFQRKLDEDPALKSAFDALTPGRKRAYAFYLSAPKRSGTRASRVEKCVPRILAGKGLNDR